MELVLALIIGLVWLVLGARDKIAMHDCERHGEIFSKYLKEIHDLDLEHELERRVKNPKFEDEINAEIRSVWESLPAIYPVESTEMAIKEKVAILMAKRGFLPYVDIVRTCYYIEQKRYHVLNVWLKEELNRHGRDVELSEAFDQDGHSYATEILPRKICAAERVKLGNTLKACSRTNYGPERERQKRMCTWIERCPHGRDFGVSPDKFATEEEYRRAVQSVYMKWKTGQGRFASWGYN